MFCYVHRPPKFEEEPANFEKSPLPIDVGMGRSELNNY